MLQNRKHHHCSSSRGSSSSLCTRDKHAAAPNLPLTAPTLSLPTCYSVILRPAAHCPRTCPTLLESSACLLRHMQPLSSAMSSSEGEGRQLQRRLDVPAETSSFATRPLLLWAFQSSQWQLQAVFGPRPSLLRVSAAQSCALGSHFGAKQRQSLLTCSRLCVTLAVRLLCFGGQCREVSAEESRLHSVAAPQISWAVGGGCTCGCRLRALHRQPRCW